jgi:hypothetical protein
MRSMAPSFVVAPPTGAKVRTRLHLSTADEEVLLQVGEYLSVLAGKDLAVRCRLGRVRTLGRVASGRSPQRVVAGGPAR